MTQIVSYETKVATVRELLQRSKGQIAMALPRHMTADRMLRVAMTSVQRTPKLLDCDPVSLVGAIIETSQLGLEPDNITGQAYLIPYGKKVQLIPGYRGRLELARRSGRIQSIYARVVHEKDEFSYSYGLEETLKHTPSSDPKPGQVTHFYAVAHLVGGGVQYEVMSKAEVDLIRARSRAATDGPWVTDYEEMGKKTALIRLCKVLPVSIETQRANTLDMLAEQGIDQDLGSLVDFTPVAAAKEKPAAAEKAAESAAGSE
ncbi:MAG: recombinase RecT [Chloroflexi bacterium]|nr:recombinase RecT [Chloroflexota bacterium]